MATRGLKVPEFNGHYVPLFQHLFEQCITNAYDLEEREPDLEFTIEYKNGEVFRVRNPNGMISKRQLSDLIGMETEMYGVMMDENTKELYFWMYCKNERDKGAALWFPLGKKYDEGG